MLETKGPAQGPGVPQPFPDPRLQAVLGPTLANVDAPERAQPFPPAASLIDSGFVSSAVNASFSYLEKLILKHSPNSKGKGDHGQASGGTGRVPTALGDGRGAGGKGGPRSWGRAWGPWGGARAAPPRAGERAPGPQESRWRGRKADPQRPTGTIPHSGRHRRPQCACPSLAAGSSAAGRVRTPVLPQDRPSQAPPFSVPGGQALKHHHFMGPTSSDVLLFLMQRNTWSLSPHVGHQGSSGTAVTTAPCEELLSALLTSFLCTNLVRS